MTINRLISFRGKATTDPSPKQEFITSLDRDARTPQEHTYTSTGSKFWGHEDAMHSLRDGTGKTIISTHVSPTGVCNLKCSYCSISSRDPHNTIPLETIKDYITKLKSRGLKAVILTGGGEPTLHPQFNEMVKWIHDDQGLDISLITNGTRTDKVDKDVWKMFSWVRVSLNFIEDWKNKIKLPEINGDLGCSLIYTGQSLEQMQEIQKFIEGKNVKYVRVQPDIVQEYDQLVKDHIALNEILPKLNDSRFFHQLKLYQKPETHVCHQAYFRPYLSEVGGGTVFPCDSVVHNPGSNHHFSKENFGICKAGEVLDFMDGKIRQKFDPCKDCRCVFSDSVNMLAEWVRTGVGKFQKLAQANHRNFV